jgi:hypothetical protein
MVVEHNDVTGIVPFQDGDDSSLEVFPTESPTMFRTPDGDFLIINWAERLEQTEKRLAGA